MVLSGQQIVHGEAICKPPFASDVLLVPYRSSVIYESISPILPPVDYYKPIACDVSDPLPFLAACLRWKFWEAHYRFRGNRCWNATKIAMPITDTTRSVATMMFIADTSLR
jgi:hypothetical protein